MCSSVLSTVDHDFFTWKKKIVQYTIIGTEAKIAKANINTLFWIRGGAAKDVFPE